MVGFALGVDDGGDSKRKFKPSAVAKPARSALRSKMAKSIPSEGSGVSFAAATTSNQDSHEEDDDDLEIQFDMLADQAAGAAAARFGHVESLPEESKEKSGKKQEGSNVAHRRQNLLSIDFTKESLMRKVKEDRERELEVRYEASVHSDPCPSVTLLTFGAARMQVSRHPCKVLTLTVSPQPLNCKRLHPGEVQRAVQVQETTPRFAPINTVNIYFFTQ